MMGERLLVLGEANFFAAVGGDMTLFAELSPTLAFKASIVDAVPSGFLKEIFDLGLGTNKGAAAFRCALPGMEAVDGGGDEMFDMPIGIPVLGGALARGWWCGG